MRPFEERKRRNEAVAKQVAKRAKCGDSDSDDWFGDGGGRRLSRGTCAKKHTSRTTQQSLLADLLLERTGWLPVPRGPGALSIWGQSETNVACNTDGTLNDACWAARRAQGLEALALAAAKAR